MCSSAGLQNRAHPHRQRSAPPFANVRARCHTPFRPCRCAPVSAVTSTVRRLRRDEAMLAHLCYTGLRTLGIPALARRSRDAGVILCYHNVVPAADAHFGDISLHMPLHAFERQMRWLAANFEIVSLGQFVNRLDSGASLRSVAALTFDDGYTGMSRHAWPVLTQLGLPATTFVVADAPGRRESFWWDHPAVPRQASAGERKQWLTRLRGDGRAIIGSLPAPASEVAPPASYAPADWREIARATAAGMSLGVHSATHRSLPVLTAAALVRELTTTREVIARESGANPEFFSYPYGLWDERVRRAVRAAGYRAAVALNHGFNRVGDDPWSLRRINVPAGIGDPAFQAWASGLRLGRREGRERPSS